MKFASKISQELLHLGFRNGTNIGYDHLYCIRNNQHALLYPFPLFVYFSFSPIKYFVKHFSRATSPRILKFCTNIGYALFYCVRGNQHPHGYHILYVSICLFLQYKFLSQISQSLRQPESSNFVYTYKGLKYIAKTSFAFFFTLFLFSISHSSLMHKGNLCQRFLKNCCT